MKNQKEKFPLGLDFFSFFVHELKSPLMSLKFQFDDLAMLSKKGEFTDVINSMEKDLDRLFRFIHDALEMKEIENEIPLKMKWELWHDILKRNIDKFEKWLFNEQMEIKVDENKNTEVFLDSRWMDSVISNLLVNAIQHSPRGSEIRIEANLQENGNFLFSITDQGQGLNEGTEDKIFHRFYNTRKSWPDSLIKGTGLGLFISKSIIEGHGGSIGVQSNKTKGCTFYFTLPQGRSMSIKQAS